MNVVCVGFSGRWCRGSCARAGEGDCIAGVRAAAAVAATGRGRLPIECRGDEARYAFVVRGQRKAEARLDASGLQVVEEGE